MLGKPGNNTIKNSSSEITIYRILCIADIILIPAFWVIYKITDPESYDPIEGRLFIAGLGAVLLFFSYISGFVRKHMIYFMYGLYAVATYWFIFYLLVGNNFASDYVIGFMIVIYAISLGFEKNNYLLLYSVFVIAMVGIAAYTTKDLRTKEVFILGSVGSIFFISYLVTLSRNNSRNLLERLSLVASQTENAVIISNNKGKIEWVNNAFIRTFGYSLDKFNHEVDQYVEFTSTKADIKEFIKESISEKKSLIYESQHEDKLGEKIWTTATLTPVFDEYEKLRKLIVVESDITKIKEAEKNVKKANILLEEKNKNITASIKYASRIQTAILPSESLIKQSLPESFVYFLPRDIVSGDFYWYIHKNNITYVAIIDCTGHGVPGAFMSLIGYSQLNKIIIENNTGKPSEILDDLNLAVIRSLNQDELDSNSRDGMDIALLKIDFNTKIIQFAGANRPLYIFKDQNLQEIKGNKMPIGGNYAYRDGKSFTNHTFELDQDASFYIFTDGFPDQFGGSEKKKFSSRRFKEFLSTIQNLSCAEQHIKIREEFEAHKGQDKQIDDVLVMGFKISA